MIFWFAVLIGVGGVVIGVKKRLFPMWAVLFNMLVSIYLGVMLSPLAVELIFGSESSGYHKAGCVGGIAVAVFAILQTIAICWLTGKFSVSFPRLFNNIGSGFLGFFSGYLAVTFLFFVVCLMPFSSEQPVVKKICESGGSKQIAAKSIEKACGFVGALSLQLKGDAAGGIIDKLIHSEDEAKSREIKNPG